MSMSDCVMCWDTPCSCGYDPCCNQTAHAVAVKLVKAVKEGSPEIHELLKEYDTAKKHDSDMRKGSLKRDV